MAMVIRASGFMSRLADLCPGDHALLALRSIVGGECVAYSMPCGGDVIFARDAQDSGLPFNACASNIVNAAHGYEAMVALYGDCVLFRDGELGELEDMDLDLPDEGPEI